MAAAACSAKAASSIPGTRPSVTRAIFAMVGAPSTLRKVTVASVRIDSGVKPAPASMLANAIEKHEA